MTLAVGTNCITQAEDKLVDMIAASSTFQTWVDAASAAAAEAHIHVHTLPEPSTAGGSNADSDVFDVDYWSLLGNYALVTTHWENGFSWEFESVTNAYEYLGRGVLFFELNQLFLLQRPGTHMYEDTRSSLNTFGDILSDIIEVCGQYPYLGVDRIDMMYHGWNEEDEFPQQIGQFSAGFEVTWSSGNTQ